MPERLYDNDKSRRGHVWERDEDGYLNLFAYTEGAIHNGPKCIKCGYGFCHHCNDLPQERCAGKPE